MKALDKIKDMIDFCDAVGCHRALYESLKAVESELEALQQRSCKTCKYYNTERPRSHPNYAECNKRDCPLSYVEVHYAFCCSEHTPKEQ